MAQIHNDTQRILKFFHDGKDFFCLQCTRIDIADGIPKQPMGNRFRLIDGFTPDPFNAGNGNIKNFIVPFYGQRDFIRISPENIFRQVMEHHSVPGAGFDFAFLRDIIPYLYAVCFQEDVYKRQLSAWLKLMHIFIQAGPIHRELPGIHSCLLYTSSAWIPI